jgi:hypothetical protein
VVSGYEPMWGTATIQPRYDTAGRPVGASKTCPSDWWKAIPPGYQLVPAGGSPVNSKTQTGDGGGAGKRAHVGQGERAAKRPSKTFKVEATSHESARGQGAPPGPLSTREERLQHHEQFLASRGPRAPFVPRPGTVCFYCGKTGHFVRACKLKQADLAAGADEDAKTAVAGAGNEARA